MMNKLGTLTRIELPCDSRVNFTKGMKYLVINDSNTKSKVVSGVEDNTSDQGAIESARCLPIIWGNFIYDDGLMYLASDKYQVKSMEYLHTDGTTKPALVAASRY
jgi:hypothetical protein